ncbi:helix-turn-helix domain-containing protein [Paenibacillus montanisoli]|uniref:AraC family transcriptional regulator n=1 Tax=Paenibacillus montanisoli TaxID=2081970 RepID=A0A328U7S9_9BACL|nr:AraC family transcriptional regulator [Paenibacillus montanisoli]RAP77025.1 AraC family transcriptional regulator [Paenibacillus montanisoli]
MEQSQTVLDAYHRTRLEQTIVIDRIITMFYFEFGKDYEFTGERHDFWEFLYVDRGEIEVMADDTRHLLKQGMMIFHKPNEYHRFYAVGGKAPNLIVMTFECGSEAIGRFRDLVLALDDEERNLLAGIVKEGMNAFEFPFQHPLKRREDAKVGSEQLIKCYLETFLLRLLRRQTMNPRAVQLSSAAKERTNDELAHHIAKYLDDRLDEAVSLEDISRTFMVGKTKLKELFKRTTGYSVMAYAANARMEKAKLMIRENTDNMTEIAEKLGFSSIHYFSKAFKKHAGMTPTEYAKTVKARLS